MMLFHGSPVRVPKLRPNKGLLYAARDRHIAVAFALAIRPDERGRCRWQFEMSGAAPRISIDYGWFDASGVGYLYRLPANGFEQVHYEYISHASVVPVDVETIQSADYAGWIETRGTR
jgi:hypothetical protein